MSAAMNPVAPHHLPVFITEPGQSDLFLNGAAIFLVAAAIGLGSVYFRLHALPEHLAHKNANKLQFEIVAVLALLALFTHNNALWVAALLLALVPIPDFHGPLARMADALSRIAGGRWRRPNGEEEEALVEGGPAGTVHAEGGASAPLAAAAPAVSGPTVELPQEGKSGH